MEMANLVKILGIMFAIMFFACAAFAVMELDLSNYPELFTEEYNSDVVFVIGDYADVADAIGSVDIATSLQAAFGRPYLIGEAKLASEIDEIEDYNLISIGGPCANPVTSELMGYPEDCNEGFIPGHAFIRLYPNGKHIAMVVAGATAIDTQRASWVLARYGHYGLRGLSVDVEGTNLHDMIISPR